MVCKKTYKVETNGFVMQSRRPGSCICGLSYRAKGITIPSYCHSYSKSVIQLGIVWVYRETHTSEDMRMEVKTTLGIRPPLVICLRQRLLFSAAQVRVSGLLASGDFPVVTSYLTLGIPDYRHALSTVAHLVAWDRIQFFRFVCQMLYTLSHYLSSSQTSYVSFSIYFLRL